MAYDGPVIDGDQGFDDAAESGVRSLREVRVARLVSQRELAELAGVSTSAIYQIEAGRVIPQLSVIRRLSAALGVDPQDVAEFRRAIRVRGAPC